MIEAGEQTERERLLELLNGYWRTQMVAVTVEVSVPDHLADGPLGVDELATRTGVRADRLARLLRALEGFGIVTRLEHGAYATTRAGRWLERHRRGGLHARALLTRRLWYPAWDGLLAALHGRPSGLEDTFGTSLFEHLATDPESAAVFDATMAESTSIAADEVAAVYDTTWAHTVVDLGGGSGALLAGLLGRNPRGRGVLVETDSVVDRARSALASQGLDQRCVVRSGDFFDHVPGDADLYLLSWIVHDWDDAQAVQLLTNCRHAMTPRARLLVIEAVLPDEPQPSTRTLYDLHMMAVAGGRERTEAEYDQLFSAAGLRRVATIPTAGLRDILDVRVA